MMEGDPADRFQSLPERSHFAWLRKRKRPRKFYRKNWPARNVPLCIIRSLSKNYVRILRAGRIRPLAREIEAVGMELRRRSWDRIFPGKCSIRRSAFRI